MRRAAEARQQRIVVLWERGLTVEQIAHRMRLGTSTVYRHLRLVGIPTGARFADSVVRLTSLPRAPYWQLHHHGGRGKISDRNPIVLGRKFCSGCGRWRQLCDFPPDTRRVKRHALTRARCEACVRIGARYYQTHLSPEQAENRRERQRFWKHKQRRAAGVPEITYQRRSVVDTPEWVYLDASPIVAALDAKQVVSDVELAMRAGVPPRAIYRLRNGESAHVRLDVADKLAYALGLTLALVYGDTPVTHNLPKASAA
jgi:hypothetical protein